MTWAVANYSTGRVSPVPVQTWARCAQSRCGRGSGEVRINGGRGRTIKCIACQSFTALVFRHTDTHGHACRSLVGCAGSSAALPLPRAFSCAHHTLPALRVPLPTVQPATAREQRAGGTRPGATQCRCTGCSGDRLRHRASATQTTCCNTVHRVATQRKMSHGGAGCAGAGGTGRVRGPVPPLR